MINNKGTYENLGKVLCGTLNLCLVGRLLAITSSRAKMMEMTTIDMHKYNWPTNISILTVYLEGYDDEKVA